MKIKNIDSYINDDIFSTLDYPTIKYNSEDITEFVVKIKDISNLKKMNQNNPLYVLIFNLLGELTYTYDDFKIDNWESLEGILEECDKYIYSLKNINHEIHDVEYFKIALKEIKEMKKLICKETIIFKNGKYEVSISDLDKTIKTLMKNKYSFLLKYISISNLYMSSGEETILNMMSRILFLSQLDLYFKKEDYKLRDNILLLIDEIDLYLHPEWQRKILSTLIKELNNCFPNHMFQIILTSHSPIVLSDIPTQNCIFLKRENEKVINVEKVSQTFGSSIYNLYKDAFFLENGLATGEFAKKYINCLAKEIKELQISKEETINENFDDIEKRIDLIGEPIIRKQLRKMLHESTKAFKPLPSEEKNEVIQFLEQQKRMLEFQIKKLKESNYD